MIIPIALAAAVLVSGNTYSFHQPFSILDETKYESFRAKLDETANIETVYIVTDSELNFRDMARGLKCSNMYQLYRDYMDNFRINVRG